MKYTIEIYGYGGEYTLGFVNNEEEKSILLELAEECDVRSSNYFDDFSIEGSNYTDIIGCYGPTFDESYITIQSVDGDEETYEIKDYCKNLIMGNPYLNTKKALENDNNIETLVFGTQTVDKGYFGALSLETDNFDPKNLYFLTVNLDETFGEILCIQGALYFTKEQLIKRLSDELKTCTEKKKELISEYIGNFNECEDDEISSILDDFIYYVKSMDGIEDWKYMSLGINELSDLEIEFDIDTSNSSKGSYAMLMTIDGEYLQELK